MRTTNPRKTREDTATIWHRRLAHLGKDNVLKLQDLATGIAVDTNYEIGICEPCQEGKQTRQPSHEPAKRAKRPGELVHSDLCGPITPPSVGGHNMPAHLQMMQLG